MARDMLPGVFCQENRRSVADAAFAMLATAGSQFGGIAATFVDLCGFRR